MSKYANKQIRKIRSKMEKEIWNIIRTNNTTLIDIPNHILRDHCNNTHKHPLYNQLFTNTVNDMYKREFYRIEKLKLPTVVGIL